MVALEGHHLLSFGAKAKELQGWGRNGSPLTVWSKSPSPQEMHQGGFILV